MANLIDLCTNWESLPQDAHVKLEIKVTGPKYDLEKFLAHIRNTKKKSVKIQEPAGEGMRVEHSIYSHYVKDKYPNMSNQKIAHVAYNMMQDQELIDHLKAATEEAVKQTERLLDAE